MAHPGHCPGRRRPYRYCSLGIAPDDTIYISYRDPQDGSLKCNRRPTVHLHRRPSVGKKRLAQGAQWLWSDEHGNSVRNAVWICVALLAYVYAGYPLLVGFLARFFPALNCAGVFDQSVRCSSRIQRRPVTLPNSKTRLHLIS